MIYDKLRKLPKVIQMEIIETGDITLLSDENTEIEILIELWSNLQEQFNSKYNKQGSAKIFNVNKEIEYQSNRYIMIQLCCQQLQFSDSTEVIQMLIDEGYSFDANSKHYHAQIDRIHRESKGIQVNISRLKNQLPNPESSNVNDNSIIEVMASYSAVLGIAFDFNTCSVEAFHAYESQVKAKIKSLEASANKSKK